MLYLDTHVVVWLYAGEIGLFTPGGLKRLDRERLLISPMVQLELAFLHEIGRVSVEPALIVETLAESLGLERCDQPFARVVMESLRFGWTRDPFDRLIVAQASCSGAPLLSKDEVIRQHYPAALW